MQEQNLVSKHIHDQQLNISPLVEQLKIKQQKNQINEKDILKIRNRRFKKLEQLRKTGYFDQQEIKLRHPLLYFSYIGQYECENSVGNSQSSNFLLSNFLERNLLNLEYRELLQKQMNEKMEQYLSKEKDLNQSQIQQLKRIYQPYSKITQKQDLTQMQQEIQSSHSIGLQKQTKLKQLYSHSLNLKHHQPTDNQIQLMRESYPKNNIKSIPGNHGDVLSFQDRPQSHRLTIEQQSIQQQHLIEYCQQLFLSGQLPDIDYTLIDNNEEYDDRTQNDRDQQQKYFNEEQPNMEWQGGYNGLQDY